MRHIRHVHILRRIVFARLDRLVRDVQRRGVVLHGLLFTAWFIGDVLSASDCLSRLVELSNAGLRAALLSVRRLRVRLGA